MYHLFGMAVRVFHVSKRWKSSPAASAARQAAGVGLTAGCHAIGRIGDQTLDASDLGQHFATICHGQLRLTDFDPLNHGAEVL
jgi:hypothetical protein